MPSLELMTGRLSFTSDGSPIFSASRLMADCSMSPLREMRSPSSRVDPQRAKSKTGFHTMPRERARALSRRGTRTIIELADDYALTYAPFIHAAVREIGHNY